MQENIIIETCLSKEAVFVNYESTLAKHRLKFGEFLAPLLAENDPKILLGFWINFSSQGIAMTEPVEHWIKRAGNNCKNLGFKELGEQLCKHAVHEADHHLLMIEDTKQLINVWNKTYLPELDTNVILKQPSLEAVTRYQNLHECYIDSDESYCQIAIEYEIENLSASYGPEVLKHTLKILGEDIKKCLSFLDDHIKIDVAHTQFNKKVISSFLTSYPETLPHLMKAGSQALEIYGNFLASCYQQAKTF